MGTGIGGDIDREIQVGFDGQPHTIYFNFIFYLKNVNYIYYNIFFYSF